MNAGFINRRLSPIEFSTSRYIFKLLTMHGESKYGIYTYYIKSSQGKNIFDHLLDRIGKWI